MIGNYGVPDGNAKDSLGLPAFFESSKIHVAGLIVADNSPDYRWPWGTLSRGALPGAANAQTSLFYN